MKELDVAHFEATHKMILGSKCHIFHVCLKNKKWQELEKIKKVVDKEDCHMYNNLSVDRSKLCY